ncbi:hypothetical protein [Vreelandella rituensis]|uniref:hypothetical protein n=1 Tax=Vreelandella rituensis TaxID=2282306 RepID=UPI0011C027B3|nr:hypothetical protein [Halomonas rituensis]
MLASAILARWGQYALFQGKINTNYSDYYSARSGYRNHEGDAQAMREMTQRYDALYRRQISGDEEQEGRWHKY